MTTISNIHPHATTTNGVKKEEKIEVELSESLPVQHGNSNKKATKLFVKKEKAEEEEEEEEEQHIWPNSANNTSNRLSSTNNNTTASNNIYPLESSPLPKNNSLVRPISTSSTISYKQQKRSSTSTSGNNRRRSTTTIPDLGDLDAEEQAALEAEILARRQARRASSSARKFEQQHEDEDDQDSRVVIGTRVSEGHRNYQLMYDMLTGIRIAVGRVSAKNQRLLTTEDFTAAHKLVFDVTGNELTPGVKYDFKFKDYAPWVFRYLREKFHIDPADYMMSLTNKYILSELGSPGKSGSFFYYSRDYRFIIKTIHHTEHKFMRKVLKQYYEVKPWIDAEEVVYDTLTYNFF